MWLVLCQSDDEPGRWAFEGLRARGLTPLEFVTAEELAEKVIWEHRLDRTGVSIRISLQDGRTFESASVRGTLNRLLWGPSADIEAVAPGDREYASQELAAFFLSWLNALPGPLLNRPTSRGLAGAWRPESEWVWMAVRSGLPARSHRLTSAPRRAKKQPAAEVGLPEDQRKSVIVVGEEVIGPDVSDPIRQGCLRLAELADTRLLGINFVLGPRDLWTFQMATPFPDLRLGGEPLLDALLHTFCDEIGE